QASAKSPEHRAVGRQQRGRNSLAKLGLEKDAAGIGVGRLQENFPRCLAGSDGPIRSFKALLAQLPAWRTRRRSGFTSQRRCTLLARVARGGTVQRLR